LKQVAFPNPVHHLLQLQLSDDKNKIILMDMFGHILLEEIVQSNEVLDMSSYKAGFYFLRVENTAGVQDIKVIKD